MNETNGFPRNFESLSRLEALRESVGSEVAFWSCWADQVGDETAAGKAALDVMNYWAKIQQNMWSDDAQTLDAIEAALDAARLSRFVLQECRSAGH